MNRQHSKLIFWRPPAYRECLRRTVAALFVSLAMTPAAPSAEEATPAETTTVAVPLRFDYPLLEKLLVAQFFQGDGGVLDALDDPTGCSEMLLSDPKLGAGERLEITTTLNARLGLGAGGSTCTTLLRFQGGLAVSGDAEIRNDGTAIAFRPERVQLLDANGSPVVAQALQSTVDASARALFSRFQFDLEPELESVGRFLPAVLPRHSREQIEALLATLRVSRIEATSQALNAEVLLQLETPQLPLQPAHALSDTELAAWEERWQLMDALLVLTVKQYAAATQLQELRDGLLDALIESRYRLRDALEAGPKADDDPVREWFLQSWDALAPTIRRVALEQPGQEYLALLSVVAATDALHALDSLGPGFGLDISADGVRRLARLVIGGENEALLEYSGEVDPVLRKLLEGSTDTPPPQAQRLRFSLFPQAHADDFSRLNSWAPQRADLPRYLPMAGALLESTAARISRERKLDEEYRQLFRNLVLATAWQESCWRHYVVSDDRKLVPLRSGTGDVGMMQVNERIWRGFYDQQRLRWDIDYNSAAGAQVLYDYLVKYAIRRGEHRQPGGIANLARASYSAYNGGPSQVSRYRRADASDYGRKVDRAFWDKYRQVAGGNELAVSSCLGGSLKGSLAAVNPGASSSAFAVAAGSAGEGFTLQLGAFSSRDAAEKFIRDHALGEKARVHRRSTGTASYLVIYGDYASRAAAEQAVANLPTSLTGQSPWIRSRKDI